MEARPGNTHSDPVWWVDWAMLRCVYESLHESVHVNMQLTYHQRLGMRRQACWPLGFPFDLGPNEFGNDSASGRCRCRRCD